jgi:hypothetical protein
MRLSAVKDFVDIGVWDDDGKHIKAKDIQRTIGLRKAQTIEVQGSLTLGHRSCLGETRTVLPSSFT